MKREKLFVGLDPSINATGILIINQDSNIIEQKLFSCKVEDGAIEDYLIKYENEISFIPNIAGLQMVYLEGPAYHAAGRSILQMGAIHFISRLIFYKKNIPYKVISPGALKKFVTGKGNSKKDLMLLKTYKKWGIEFEDDNLCDAYGLSKMALHDYISN
jgi:crossover junction endodeoxyribonuclease RuvC